MFDITRNRSIELKHDEASHRIVGFIRFSQHEALGICFIVFLSGEFLRWLFFSPFYTRLSLNNISVIFSISVRRSMFLKNDDPDVEIPIAEYVISFFGVSVVFAGFFFARSLFEAFRRFNISTSISRCFLFHSFLF